MNNTDINYLKGICAEHHLYLKNIDMITVKEFISLKTAIANNWLNAKIVKKYTESEEEYHG